MLPNLLQASTKDNTPFLHELLSHLYGAALSGVGAAVVFNLGVPAYIPVALIVSLTYIKHICSSKEVTALCNAAYQALITAISVITAAKLTFGSTSPHTLSAPFLAESLINSMERASHLDVTPDNFPSSTDVSGTKHDLSSSNNYTLKTREESLSIKTPPQPSSPRGINTLDACLSRGKNNSKLATTQQVRKVTDLLEVTTLNGGEQVTYELPLLADLTVTGKPKLRSRF